MMGRIIDLPAGAHHEAQSLLPWYASGRLDAAEQARVEAHLSGCAECRADLGFEQRLSAEITALPVETGEGWARLRRRLDLQPTRRGLGRAIGERLTAAWRRAGRHWRGGRPWLGWALAAQFALLVGLVAVLAMPGAQADRYRALGSPATAGTGNVVLIFRPRTTERELRATLEASGARLVDGPTAAGAYVVRVAAADRGRALAKLRRRADIVLAEPIDAPGSP